VKLFLKTAIFCLAGALLSANPTAGPAAATATPVKAEGEDFDIPVPMGMPVRGLKIPHRDRTGKVTMILEADIAKKIDDSQIEMDELKIDAFDDDGRKVFVQIAHSIFNLETRVLSGDTRSLIRRDDFEITGDSIDFDTRSRNGTLRGNVKMIIQSSDIAQ
jgi:hypothetical protein